MKTELEKLGYTKKENKYFEYVEWENKHLDIRISYIGKNQSIYIRKASKQLPAVISNKELMALLIDLGYAELTK